MLNKFLAWTNNTDKNSLPPMVDSESACVPSGAGEKRGASAAVRAGDRSNLAAASHGTRLCIYI